MSICVSDSAGYHAREIFSLRLSSAGYRRAYLFLPLPDISGTPTAIDDKVGAGHIGRCVRSKKDNRSGNIFSYSQSPQRRVLIVLFGEIRIVRRLGKAPKAQTVHPNIILAENSS